VVCGVSGKHRRPRPQQVALTDEVFTVGEVARVLKVSEQTIRNWIDAGVMPALRIGRRLRIRRSVLQDVLEHGLELADDEPARAAPSGTAPPRSEL